MANIRYSTEVNKADWEYVLTGSKYANVFHSMEYFDIVKQDGHELLYACCYDGNIPIAIITGVLNKAGYHSGIVEIGTKSGGYPIVTDEFAKREIYNDITNNFIEYFANIYLAGNRFLFYPCDLTTDCVLAAQKWNCSIQYDSIAVLDLTPDINDLRKNLNQNCRNAVRFAQKKGVTARIVNKIEYLELFYKYYKELRNKLNTKYMSFDELIRRFKVLTKNNLADLWVAFLDDTPLAYAFIWKFKKYINFVYGSSSPETLSLKPNNLLQWEIISFYKSNGFSSYNMWGVRNMNLCQNNVRSQDINSIEGYGKFKLTFGSSLKHIPRFVRN